MKKLISFLILFLMSLGSFAQVPQGFNYQAVARNASGLAITSQPIGLQISLRQTSALGTIVYTETHAVTSNNVGIVNLVVGNGTVVTGTFNTIDWAAGPYFIEVSMDVTGGTTYSLMGTQQLMSVPYALYSANGTPGPTGAIGATGPSGADGLNGATGATGADGLVGATGNDGINGVTGATGADGLVGATGNDGINGAVGATGATGIAGTNGTNGATGATGLTGTTGTAGTNGTNGATGATGSSLVNYNQKIWAGSTSVAVGTWVTIPNSTMTITTNGGPLMIIVSLSAVGGGHFTCQPIIDGVWAGSYSSMLNPGDPYWKEGLIYTGGGGWASWNKTKIYTNIPAGTHTLQIQCATDSGTVQVGTTTVTCSLSFVELGQ